MSQGYSQGLVEANRKASRSHPGVALGRMCIKAKVPVMEVAEHFGLSRQAIYSWFKGVSSPRPDLVKQIEKYMYQIGRRLG